MTHIDSATPLFTAALGFGVLVFTFAIRLIPHFLAPLGIGVDHWYWREYIEKYRRDKQFPPELPQYLLESHQWYPPFFPLLLAHLPASIFDRFSHILAILIDLLRVTMLMGIMYRLTHSSMVMAISGGVYAMTPLLVSYNVQLNPRGLAALMLDFIVVAVLLAFYYNAPLWVWIAPIPLLGLLLLTHKMTTQLFWFLGLVCGALWDWHLLLLIPLSILIARAMSRGFYWKVLLAHWDIVSFYYRNWRWIGANPVMESPIYGFSKYETPRKLHRKGVLGIAKHVYLQLGYNPFAWLMIATLPVYSLFPIPYLGFLHLVVAWLALILIFSLATSLLPFMRCLGAGHLYLYNAAFPASILWGFLFLYWENRDVTIFIGFGAIISTVAIARFYLHVYRSGTVKIDSEFESALEFLATSPKGTVMCASTQWYDVVAYKTRQPVLFGAHGYGFKMLEPIFPRLMVTVSELIRRYKLRYVIFEQGSVTDKFLADIPANTTHDFGRYRIVSLNVPPEHETTQGE